MDRWRSLSVLLFKKKKKKDIEIITSCCNFSNFRTQTQLQICAELYIQRVLYDSGPKFLFWFSDDSYREILTDSFSSSELCFVHVSRCHFIWDVVFIYWAKHFWLDHFFFCLFVFFYFLYTWSSPCFVLFSYTVVCQYVCVCHISFSGEGLEF